MVLPVDQRTPEWYVERFNRAWGTLPKYPKPVSYLDVGKHGLAMTRLCDVVLFRKQNHDFSMGCFDLLIQAQPELGARGSHVGISLEYGSHGGIGGEHNNGVCFESTDGYKYLIIMFDKYDHSKGRQEEVEGEEYITQLAKDLGRYDIRALFSCPIRYWVDEDVVAHHLLVDVNKMQRQWDQMYWDGFTSEVAMRRRWTNTDLLHFRTFPWELPK